MLAHKNELKQVQDLFCLLLMTARLQREERNSHSSTTQFLIFRTHVRNLTQLGKALVQQLIVKTLSFSFFSALVVFSYSSQFGHLSVNQPFRIHVCSAVSCE